MALLVVSAVAPVAGGDAALYAELAAMLAVIVGVIAVVSRFLRLGWIADYFSRAVLVGYLHGIAVVLVCGQLEKLTGIDISATDQLPQLKEFVQEIGNISWTTFAVGTTSLAIVLLLRWKAPKVPGALVVVAGGIIVSYGFDFASHGIATVGYIPSGLPSFDWPAVGVSNTLQLLPGAMGIFAVGYADLILMARSFAGRNGQHVDANQELLAFGAANVAAGVTQAFPVGASGSRTAVNDQIGGRSQVVGLVAAGVAVLVLLFLTEPMAYLPKACLGAVIVAAAIGLIVPEDWRALARAGRSQVIIAVACFVGVIVFGVLEALVVAVGLSIVEVVMRSATPHDAVLGHVERLDRWADVSLHPSARVTPGVVVYRLDDRLFYANSRYVKGRIREAVAGAPTETRFLVFDAEALIGIDASGVEAAEQILDALDMSDVTFVVARLKAHIQELFEATGLTERIGADHLFATVDGAVAWCAAQSDPETEPET